MPETPLAGVFSLLTQGKPVNVFQTPLSLRAAVE
jgi:hypothetical protein